MREIPCLILLPNANLYSQTENNSDAGPEIAWLKNVDDVTAGFPGGARLKPPTFAHTLKTKILRTLQVRRKLLAQR